MPQNYTGVIIEESLEDKSVLQDLKILETKVEEATESHKTLWVKQWTLHTVEVPEDRASPGAGRPRAGEVAEKLSKSLDSQHAWYADFKNDTTHFIIFRNKVFKIDRSSKEQYDAATAYGLTLGIPDYQLDFSPHIQQWER